MASDVGLDEYEPTTPLERFVLAQDDDERARAMADLVAACPLLPELEGNPEPTGDEIEQAREAHRRRAAEAYGRFRRRQASRLTIDAYSAQLEREAVVARARASHVARALHCESARRSARAPRPVRRSSRARARAPARPPDDPSPPEVTPFQAWWSVLAVALDGARSELEPREWAFFLDVAICRVAREAGLLLDHEERPA